MRQEKPIKALIECYQMIFNKTMSPIDFNEQNKKRGCLYLMMIGFGHLVIACLPQAGCL